MGAKRVGFGAAALACALVVLPVVVMPLGTTVAQAAAPPQFIVGTATDLTSGGSCTAGVATSTCSLRAAVAAANASTGATITVPAGTYLLGGGSGNDTGDLDINKPMTIVGAAKPNAPAATSIVGSGDRVVDLASTATAVTIRGVRLTGGNPGANNMGGGIRTAAGSSLTLLESTVSGNTAKEGAGVHNSGTVTIDRSTLSGNTASGKGGGLFNAGTATVRNSTVNGNAANGGGGIASSGTVQITQSNVTANNSNNSSGGGLYRVGGAFTV